MALKDILVGVDPSTAGEGRLKLALSGTGAPGAHHRLLRHARGAWCACWPDFSGGCT